MPGFGSAIAKELGRQGYALPGSYEDYSIRRTYAGANQRSAGAWTWTLTHHVEEYRAIAMQYGSRHRASRCVAQGFIVTQNQYTRLYDLTPFTL